MSGTEEVQVEVDGVVEVRESEGHLQWRELLGHLRPTQQSVEGEGAETERD